MADTLGVAKYRDARPGVTALSALLADVEPQDLAGLRAAVEALGVELVEAAGREQLLARLNEREFAALLIELRSPVADSLQLAEAARTAPRAGRMPIVFLSNGPLDDDVLQAGYDMGSVDF